MFTEEFMNRRQKHNVGLIWALNKFNNTIHTYNPFADDAFAQADFL